MQIYIIIYLLHRGIIKPLQIFPYPLWGFSIDGPNLFLGGIHVPFPSWAMPVNLLFQMPVPCSICCPVSFLASMFGTPTRVLRIIPSVKTCCQVRAYVVTATLC